MFRWPVLILAYLVLQLCMYSYWSIEHSLLYIRNSTFHLINRDATTPTTNAKTVLGELLQQQATSPASTKAAAGSTTTSSTSGGASSRSGSSKTTPTQSATASTSTTTTTADDVDPFLPPRIDDNTFYNNPAIEADIAVCISGQVARWQPYHLVQGLLDANPHYRFHFFFNIQSVANRTASNIVYNTDIMNVFDPGYMTSLSYDEAWLLLHGILQTNHSAVASLVYIEPATAKQWREYFHTPHLDRITQFKDAQVTILNMYAHQPRCIEQILQYETVVSTQRQRPFRFDYIISTREDVFFFRPMNLSHVIRHLHHGQSTFYDGSTPATPPPPPAAAAAAANPANQTQERASDPYAYLGQCDVPFKRCLNFWGFNMRFFILQRAKGIRFFGNRLSFYQFLLDTNKTVDNPERFELAMANALQLTACPFAVDEYPVTAARYFAQGQYCFINFEVQHCVPSYAMPMVRQHLCTDFRRRMYLQHVYTDAKVRLKHNFTLAFLAHSHQMLNLTEQFKPLKGADLLRHTEVQHPFHTWNATWNMAVVNKIPKATAMYLSRDTVFINRTWTPLYP